MTIKHTSKFRQKVLSFLLGLSLLFNVLAPVTTVMADTLPTYTIDYYAVRDGFPYQHGGELSLYTETHPLDYAGVNDGSTAVTGPVGYVFSYWSSDEAGLNVVSWDQNYIPDTHENASYYAHFTQLVFGRSSMVFYFSRIATKLSKVVLTRGTMSGLMIWGFTMTA